MPKAKLADVTLHYEERGRGEPLLLIAGQANDYTMWEPIADDFASRYRVILYDHRGTGQSDKPESPAYSTELFAQDAVHLLDALGIARAHLYGISMGGRIAQLMAAVHPKRVASLVLGATTPGNAHGIPRDPEISAAMARSANDPEEMLRWLLDQMVSPQYAARHPEYAAWQRKRLQSPLPPRIRALHFQASETHDAWEKLPLISSPTLVIHGDQDTMNPTANARILVERIPGAELCLLPGGRHGYFIELREQASRAVLDFLGRHPMA